MNIYEKESLLKNFMVFFILLEALLVLLFIQIYQNSKADLHKEILHQMQLCSYFLKCKKFDVDFSLKRDVDLNRLYSTKDGIDAFFPIPKSQKYNLQMHYPLGEYNKNIDEILKYTTYRFILFSVLLLIVSTLFTLYSLNPIRKALKINDEFIKDILHDFNTPIASMVLNIEMLNDEYGDNLYIRKLSQTLNTILLLQENLKTFLHHSPSQMELIDINILTKERVSIISSLYPNIEILYKEISTLKAVTNQELLTRVLDNILSNACKYNKPKGLVFVTIDKYQIGIKDTGKGIQDTKKIFQRYYTEQERGIGLGLHIIQKLTQELNIRLDIKTEINIGTEIILSFPKKECYYD